MTEQSQIFETNFEKLRTAAERMRPGNKHGEPRIDDLVVLVDTASEAYKACKDRLEGIKRAVAERMPDALPDA